MNVNLLLAEYISVHPTGFFSVINGGINALASQPVNAQGQQPCFNGHLLVRIEPEAHEAGPHVLRLKLIDADGAVQIPEANVQFQTPPQAAGPINLAIGLPIPLRKGSYAFQASVDGALKATWPVNIMEPPKQVQSSTPPANPWGVPGSPWGKWPQA